MALATFKAWAVTAGFTVVGLIALYLAPRSLVLVPQVLFYAVLILNTFYSVRFFHRIQPVYVSQALVDIVLVVVYTILAFAFGHALLFSYMALWVFLIAPVKYTLMLNHTPHTGALKQKILIDLLGTGFMALVLGIFLAGYVLTSAWLLAIVFALANVYFLFMRPMYRL